jgi:hypothetical protein
MHRYDGAMTRHDPPSTLSARDRYVLRNLLYLDHVLCGYLRVSAASCGKRGSLLARVPLLHARRYPAQLLHAYPGGDRRSAEISDLFTFEFKGEGYALHTADLRATGRRTSTANLRQLELCGVRSRLSVCLASFFYLLYR